MNVLHTEISFTSSMVRCRLTGKFDFRQAGNGLVGTPTHMWQQPLVSVRSVSAGESARSS